MIQYAKIWKSLNKQLLKTQLATYQRQKLALETPQIEFASRDKSFRVKMNLAMLIFLTILSKQSQDLSLGISKSNTEVGKQAFC